MIRIHKREVFSRCSASVVAVVILSAVMPARLDASDVRATLQISRNPTGGVDVAVSGLLGQKYRLLSAADLSTWKATGTNQTGANGTALFHDNMATSSRRNYRAELISTGQIVAALSPSFIDVSNAVTLANSGDTVVIPSGIATWLNQTLILNKSITLKGAGTTLPNQTQILNSDITGVGAVTELIRVQMSADLPVRITGIFFNNLFNPNLLGNGYQTPNKSAIRVNGRDYNGNGVALTQVRIDHNVFNKGKMAVMWSGWAYGLADHNTFSNADIAIGVWADDNFAWQREIKPGTQNAVFIEDNHFIIDDIGDYEPNEQVYHQEGGRSVIRYNNFDGSAYTLGNAQFLDSHGNFPGNPTTGYYAANNSEDDRGQPLIEVYNNQFHAHSGYRFANIRGGSTLFHDNLFIHDSQPATVVVLTEEEGWSSAFQPLRTAWPAEDQVNATFLWSNTLRFNGSATGRAMVSTDVSTTWNANDSTFIREGRDFWMKAPDATTCTTYPQVVNYPTNVIYPMRYTCITNYAPFTYPHPFVTGQN